MRKILAFAVLAALLAAPFVNAGVTRRVLERLKTQYIAHLPSGDLYVYCEPETGNRLYVLNGELEVVKEGCY